jgi:transposase InsO family protein
MSGAIHSCTALATKLRTAKASPWENGYIESFNARLRDELLNGEIFYPDRHRELATPLQHD